ncbi:MAG: tripartite tricarboxylate transporter substrate binding protein [Betaproteobacteria bacterium]|nr:tripartite tricarboxylate transporter substrate binding protein [Betaproteobacteria bacterium]
MISFRSLLGATILVCAATLASAQDFPNKPIRLVLGFPPGGSTDIAARIVAAKLKETLGQPVIVENRPGADGILAANLVARSPADGYTLMIGTTSVMTVNPVMYEKLSYDPIKDFDPVTLIGLVPVVIAVQPSLPIRNTKELIEYARANPGKLNYAAAATAHILATELFKQMANIEMRSIPYKGSASAVAGMLSGDTQVIFVEGAAMISHLKSGRLRGIAVTTAKRVTDLPDLPTVIESGLPEYEMVLFNGLFAPAGTPRPVKMKLQSEVERFAQSREGQEKFAAAGGLVAVGSTPEFLAETVKRYVERNTMVVRRGNLKPN